MAQQNPGFEVVGGTESEEKDPRQGQINAATRLLMVALGALSQRFVVAIADLFTLLTVASAFWLWSSIPAPNDRQIVALTIYGIFVLAANWIVRRK